MGTEFNWHSEDDQWDEIVAAPAGAPSAWRRLRPWLLALVLVATAAFLIYRQLQTGVDETEARLREEVLASHSLVEQAAAAGDGELLHSFLSGRDQAWTAAQETLARRGQLFDLELFGLTAAAPDGGPFGEGPLITLSNDFTTATIVADYAFHTWNSDGITQTIRLERTAVFRHGPDRWLWAPPDPDFWGNRQSSRRLAVIYDYPARDGALVQRLSRDLDNKISELCALNGMPCPPAPEVTLHFSTDPKSLLNIHDWPYHLGRGREIELPAPSLIGRPVDEAAYQALFRGYAGLVIAPLVADFVNYECCAQVHLFNALLDKQLSQLELRPWPLTPDDYQALLTEFSQDPAYREMVSDPPPRPLPIPDQPILISCLADSEQAGDVLLYRPGATADTRRWQLAARAPNGAAVERLELLADNILLVLERGGRISLVKGEQQIRLNPSPIRENITYFPAAIDPARARFVARISDPVAAETRHELVDGAQCFEGGCHPQPLAGPIIWSPDGRQTLIIPFDEEGAGANDSLLLRGDADGRPLTDGRPVSTSLRWNAPPFWLDNETYGYLQVTADAGDELQLAIAQAADDQQLAAIAIDDLIATWPGGQESAISPVVGAIRVNPVQTSQILISLVLPATNETTLFWWDWIAGTVTSSNRYILGSAYVNPVFSPDGRWLATYLSSGISSPLETRLFLTDLDTEPERGATTHELGRADYYLGDSTVHWSSDGQWLLRQAGDLIYLVAPAHDYQQLIIGDAAGCVASFVTEDGS